MDESPGMIYVDHAATTPVHPDVLRAMQPYYAEQFGNPSSLYRLAAKAQLAVDRSREQVAAVLNARASEVIFTSGGSESISAALKGVAFAQSLAGVGRRIISTAVEHHAVLHTLDYLEPFGFDVVRLPVDSEGRVDPQAVAHAVDEQTVLVSVMLANNEVGTIEPIAAISEALRERSAEFGRRIPFHTDAVQAAGHLPIDVDSLDVDLLSISAHKFRGPKGMGALYLRRGTPYLAQQNGGGQERNRRAGTENVPGIVGLGEALTLAEMQQEAFIRHTTSLRDRFIDGVMTKVPDAVCNGPRYERLPNNANVRFDGVDGQALLEALDGVGVAASSGSACTSSSWEPSHVLVAMGADQDAAAGSLRCTFDLENTAAEVDTIVEYLQEIVPQLQRDAAAARI
jgi:cysteine desulfurase